MKVARAYTRNGFDWSKQFASICTAVAAIPARCIVLDGEVVVQGENAVTPDVPLSDRSSCALP
jgi:bifunctional non-homologous end joining protein LigD